MQRLQNKGPQWGHFVLKKWVQSSPKRAYCSALKLQCMGAAVHWCCIALNSHFIGVVGHWCCSLLVWKCFAAAVLKFHTDKATTRGPSGPKKIQSILISALFKIVNNRFIENWKKQFILIYICLLNFVFYLSPFCLSIHTHTKIADWQIVRDP